MDPRHLVLLIPAILWALSFHELGHGWMALRFGDPTARDLGRLTLNPLKHLDPVGTLMMFLAGFGWAKPVPVDTRNLAHPLRDGLWIAAAGPAANFITALACGLLLQLIYRNESVADMLGWARSGVLELLFISVQVNLGLGVFNLLPIPPLDGAGVLKGLVSERTAESLARWDAVGPMLLLLLILVGRMTPFDPIGFLMGPILRALRALVSGGLF